MAPERRAHGRFHRRRCGIQGRPGIGLDGTQALGSVLPAASEASSANAAVSPSSFGPRAGQSPLASQRQFFGGGDMNVQQRQYSSGVRGCAKMSSSGRNRIAAIFFHQCRQRRPAPVRRRRHPHLSQPWRWRPRIPAQAGIRPRPAQAPAVEFARARTERRLPSCPPPRKRMFQQRQKAAPARTCASGRLPPSRQRKVPAAVHGPSGPPGRIVNGHVPARHFRRHPPRQIAVGRHQCAAVRPGRLQRLAQRTAQWRAPLALGRTASISAIPLRPVADFIAAGLFGQIRARHRWWAPGARTSRQQGFARGCLVSAALPILDIVLALGADGPQQLAKADIADDRDPGLSQLSPSSRLVQARQHHRALRQARDHRQQFGSGGNRTSGTGGDHQAWRGIGFKLAAFWIAPRNVCIAARGRDSSLFPQPEWRAIGIAQQCPGNAKRLPNAGPDWSGTRSSSLARSQPWVLGLVHDLGQTVGQGCALRKRQQDRREPVLIPLTVSAAPAAVGGARA